MSPLEFYLGEREGEGKLKFLEVIVVVTATLVAKLGNLWAKKGEVIERARVAEKSAESQVVPELPPD